MHPIYSPSKVNTIPNQIHSKLVSEAMAISIKIACVVLMCMVVVGSPIAEAAITCGQVVSGIAPCLSYLQNGGAVPTTCCDGIRRLVAAAQSTADKQTACNCLKSAAASTKFDPANAASLPGKCGVNLPYKISTSTNCNTIKF
ncbi:putative plant lipid transfer protein/Par allergen [Lupinus albus]|uniref:Non-specific lipid-transfer protein n=1 Tax=Lupinus albus TaxID=3870 RepID=A0A6A4PNU3_LUPAL|nr:putative plant lipid transfer protein/Par allergen [Lupinus albus]